jgi:GNAT superfamily N-acetyltransferase
LVDLRFAEASDLAKIGNFLPELGGSHFHERFPGRTVRDYYQWKYFGNPFGKAWVGIAVSGDRVVSSVSAMPKPLQVRGRRVLAYELGDFLTAPDFRRRGLFSQLVRLVLEKAVHQGAALVYVRPNDTSFPLLMKLGFQEPRQIHQRSYPRPGSWLARKVRIPDGLSKGLGLDALGRCLAAPPVSDAGLEVTPLSRFGRETDHLWEQVGHEYEFLLARESAYLNWRYADSPTPFQIWLAQRDGKPAGYLVGFAGAEQGIAAILDLFASRGDHSAVRALLHCAFREYHRLGVRGIYAWTLAQSPQSAASRSLRRACPLVRGPVLHLAVHARSATPLPESGWHLSPGDFDGV